MEIFEKASKLKLRFLTSQGHLSTEDLWELSLSDLDTIAKRVNNQLRDEGEESFIPSTTAKKSSHNDLRLELLKHVINTKVAEQDARKGRAEMQQRLSQLKALAETKATEQLASQSLEDIQKQIAELEATYSEGVVAK